jgi:hypothetical protein
MRYVVIENTPSYLPEDDEPFIGSWDECAEVMDETIRFLLDQDYVVQTNEGVGFRTPGGIRRTYLLPPDASEHTLSRVIEVLPLEDDES